MKLTVKPLVSNRSERSVAALERETIAELGIESGEYVSLEGPTGESAVVEVTSRPTEDVDDRTIRLEDALADRLGVEVGGTVRAEPVDVRSAERVEVALPEDVSSKAALEFAQRDTLVGRVLSDAETVTVSLAAESGAGSRSVPIEVVDLEPTPPVVVEDWTSVVLSPEAASIDDTERDQPTPAVTYDDVGGLAEELDRVREVVELPMRYPDVFDRLGIEPPKGVLLYGPPGTGKTLIARAMANEVGAHFQTLRGPEIVSKYYGESEERLREVFAEAEENAPAIVFVDEIDAIAPKREDVGDAERRIVAQLLSLLDGGDSRGQVVVMGTTNRVDSVDPALRRPGRFDREIEIGVPDADERAEILDIHAADVSLSEDVDLERYAERTHGFVGADLENLIRESAMCALRRLREDSPGGRSELSIDGPIEIGEPDVEAALREIEPSAMREVFVEVPDAGWTDIGGLEDAKRTLREAIQWPLEYADAFDRVSLRPATGVLLYGPPGTGKTLLARAVANEAQSNFISIKGPELVDKYVGESERGIRNVFSKARENAPTVLVFDEIDAIAGTRNESGETAVGERVVSQLLTELDGLEDLEDVVVLATTNRPDRIDDALLRAGRFERHVRVGEPDRGARREIFEVHLRDRPLADDVDLETLAERTEGTVGAAIEGICRTAAMNAVRDYVEDAPNAGSPPDLETLVLTAEHFERALERTDGESADEFGRSADGFDALLDGE
ncbi:CDC48 family AAA ATPase [Natronococcus occultus]|uniref:AAA family ATPase, CDC48 subfamily n=1 Tax=Natronococcus occultus SP4 TaxID=694430 RepID=L0JZ18_9EURY|nr:CDC48 family AAA ATPase [Natronococcus occultus]AGB37555.1 AAA family ATPase, CDC48 subfamily [Natronococcus occultus SP4]